MEKRLCLITFFFLGSMMFGKQNKKKKNKLKFVIRMQMPIFTK